MRRRPTDLSCPWTLRLAWLPALVVLCGACERTAPSAGATARDSLGVAIVESVAPAWAAGEGWTVDSAPALSIGAADGPDEEVFDRISGVHILPDGGIAVASEGHRQVRLYDRAGRRTQSWGRDGSGPGEFVALDLLSVAPGDTLVAWDFITGRVSLIPARGGVPRYVTLGSASGGPDTYWLAGRLHAGPLVLRSATASSPDAAAGASRESVLVMLASPHGTTPMPLAVVAGQPTYRVADGGGITGYAIPFSPDAQIAVAGDSVFLGSGDALDIRVFGPGGLRRIVRARIEGPPVAASDVERFREQLQGQTLPGSPARRRIETFLGAVAFPARRPAHGRLMVGDDGTLWARVAAGPDAPERWNLFDPRGAWLGVVTMPVGFHASSVQGELVAGVNRDAEGVERIWLLRLNKD
jgi:hypothetical protein